MKNGLLQLSGIVVDLVHRVDAMPSPGEEVEAQDFMVTPGGGFNAMVAARRLDVPVSYGGVIGTGPFASMVERALEEMRIDRSSATRAAIDQGSCVVLVHPDGERSFITHHGAERRLDRQQLDALDAARFPYALLTGYTLYKPESAAVMVPWLAALPRPPVLLFDPGPIVAGIAQDVLQPVLARADWISANLHEAAVLTGSSDPARAAAMLGADRVGALVRAGRDGCWLSHKGQVQHIAGFAVDAIDSNGAGDAHDGAFIAALIAGADPHAAAVIANAGAALSTTRLGPATAPGWTEIAALLQSAGCEDSLPERIRTSNRAS